MARDEIAQQPAAFRPLAMPLAASTSRKTDPFGRLVAKHPPEAIAPGTTFVDEGGPAADVFKIEAGVVKLFKLLADGRRQVVGFLVSGDVFGFYLSRSYTAGAEAIGIVKLRRFSRR